MDKILAVLIGLAWGGAIGLSKYFFVWRPVVRKPVNTEKGTSKVMGRYFIGLFLDVFALFLPYLLKEYLPFSLEFVLIGTAFALAILTRLYSFNKILGSSPADSAAEHNFEKKEPEKGE